jgi:hypothetical protein
MLNVHQVCKRVWFGPSIAETCGSVCVSVSCLVAIGSQGDHTSSRARAGLGLALQLFLFGSCLLCWGACTAPWLSHVLHILIVAHVQGLLSAKLGPAAVVVAPLCATWQSYGWCNRALPAK